MSVSSFGTSCYISTFRDILEHVLSSYGSKLPASASSNPHIILHDNSFQMNYGFLDTVHKEPQVPHVDYDLSLLTTFQKRVDASLGCLALASLLVDVILPSTGVPRTWWINLCCCTFLKATCSFGDKFLSICVWPSSCFSTVLVLYSLATAEATVFMLVVFWDLTARVHFAFMNVFLY